MKTKIYPLTHIDTPIQAHADPLCLHLEIICASLANSTSIFKNTIDSEDIQTTIEWCEAIGANIKKNNDKLIIKGINNNIRYLKSLFICNTNSTTAKIMIPLLCSVAQPFGIKCDKKIHNELMSYKDIFESFDVDVFSEEGIIRFEKTMIPTEKEIDGDIDIYLAAGLLIALPLLDGQSILRLIAPVRSEKSYNAILKTLKKFSIDIKHPATMRYEINGKQLYKSAKITTETDKLHLSYMSLLSQKIDNINPSIKINNYYRGSTGEATKLFYFVKKHIINYSKYFPLNTIKKKTISIHKTELTVENSLPLLMVIGSLNDQDLIISKVNLTKERIANQFQTMARIFTKLQIQYSCFDNEIIIHPGKVNKKQQVDCENDPYVAIAICILAAISDEPIVVKNAGCITKIYGNFFDDLMDNGVKIDFIHN